MAEKATCDSFGPNSYIEVDEADFTAVVFHEVLDIYPPEEDITCKYTVKSSVTPSKRDWVGLFKVGWQNSGEHCTYEWSPYIESNENDERRPTANRVVFRTKYLPKSDEEFYQFCYVTSVGEVRGASVPFQIRERTDSTDFEFCEVEDDESMLMVKNRTAILEESLSRALEDNSSLKASNEKKTSDLREMIDIVAGLEKRKSELTAQINLERKQQCSLSKDLETANQHLKAKEEELGLVKSRNAELSSDLEKLETDKKEMVVIVEHANKKCEEFAEIVEKEQMQSSEAQKSKEKLVSEKLQYLQKIAENRELTDNLQAKLAERKEDIVKLQKDKEQLHSAHAKAQDDLLQKDKMYAKMQEELLEKEQLSQKVKEQKEEEILKCKAEIKELETKIQSQQTELINANEAMQSLMLQIKMLEKEKDDFKKMNTNEANQFETKLQLITEEGFIKDEVIQRLEFELEDAKALYETEKGRNNALEEDYESAIRGLENQLEGEKALNKSLCVQTDNTVTDLQNQLEHQLQVNADQTKLLDTKMNELKTISEEFEGNKKELKAAHEKLKVMNAQLSATDSEVNALKTAKEILQTSLSMTKGKNEKTSKNSAASMYALQTAHSHLEKKYVEAKKKIEELWKDKNELKRTLSVVQGNLSATDMRHEIEQFRAKNEDLRVRLNMGAEAYKVKFIECRRLESQLKKIQKAQASGGEDAMTKIKKDLEQQQSVALALEEERKASKQKDHQIEELKQEMEKLSQDIESLSVQKVEEEATQMSGYTQQLEADLSDRQNRLTEMEEMFHNEKKEKLNLIEEIVNLQGQLKAQEQKCIMANEECEKVKILLTNEQDERDRLGEMARGRIQGLEEQVRNLTEEVDRWKKEVDRYIEAQGKMIGSGGGTREQQQQTSPVHHRTQFQWPWNKQSQYQQQGSQWIPQPWIWVQGNESEQPPPTDQHFQPCAAPTPPPPTMQSMQSMHANLECPICHILFPPSETAEKITRHVNNHLDNNYHQE